MSNTDRSVISIAAMSEEAFFRSPLAPSVEPPKAIEHEQIDVMPQDNWRVRLQVGGKRYVVDGAALAHAIEDMLRQSHDRRFAR